MKHKSIWSRFKKTRGADVPHHKYTAEMPTTYMPLPDRILLPMQQHIGATCMPVVAKGDHVHVGTLIGHTDKALGADIFSGVSGTVSDVYPVFYSSGKSDTVVAIESDKLQTIDPDVAIPVITSRDEFVAAVKKSGLVGLGGAGFPTEIKLLPPNIDEIDTLLVNGTECEPYLSTDYREIMETPETVLHGVQSYLKFFGVPRAIIGVEDNKPKAIKLLNELTADIPEIEIRSLKSRYPQGAENLLVYNITGRVVPRGKRQTDVGIVLFNVTTMSMLGKFLKTGMPLTKRRVTVSGDAIANPQNVEVTIGTKISDVIDFCGRNESARKVVVGGPMMGNAQVDPDYPIVRQNGGLLVFGEEASRVPESTNCIRCGRCTASCPMKLSPTEIKRAYDAHDVDTLEVLMADLCMGCGTCSFVCPAKLPLTPTTKLARDYMRVKLAERSA